jgi:hypothetical protein
MSYRFALFAAVAAAMIGAAHAESFRPIQAQKVDLGVYAGVAYYTAEQDGHRLVVTLQAPEAASPVRFVATLAPGQAVTLSVPRHAGEAPVEMQFVRDGEQIVMNAGPAAPHVEAHTD